MTARAELIATLAEVVLGLANDSASPERTLVGIDGRSAAGKTTFADELAAAIQSSHRPVLRASIDDFHPPGYKRLARARAFTPETYFHRGYDFERFRQQVVAPFVPSGDGRCCLKYWDSLNDCAYSPNWIDAAADTVLVVDGAFLFHPIVEDAWDYSVWLHIDWDTMMLRAIERDVAWVGDADSVKEKYRLHWRPTHEAYEARTRAPSRCDIVIDNTDVASPHIVDDVPQPLK